MTVAKSSAMDSIAGVSEFHPRGSDGYQRAVLRAPHVFGAKADYVGLARPGTVDELAAAVLAARRQGLGILRLYNESNAGARRQGEGEAIILDLGRMNRILEVNADYGYARLEPGVSFAQLARRLDAEGIPLLVDSEADPHASVLGSIYSKGTGFTPYADHVLMQCGGEYVLPDGSLLRTGMGAMPENRTWSLYKYALGPYSDGLAVQSDLMIPSQSGIWLMGRVPAIDSFAVDLDGPRALSDAIEFIRPLKIGNVLPGAIVLSHGDLDAFRTGSPSRGNVWRLWSSAYGLPSTAPIAKSLVLEGLRGVRGATIVDIESLRTDPLWSDRSRLMAGGVASGKSLDLMGNGQISPFLSFAAPMDGAAARSMVKVSRKVLRKHDLAPLFEIEIVGRSLIFTVKMAAARGDAKALSAIEKAALGLVEEMGKAGFGLIRESVEFQKLAQSALGVSPLSELSLQIESAFDRVA